MRAPSSGQAKTRLICSLPQEKVTALYAAFVRDTSVKALSIRSSDVVVFYAPAGTEAEVISLVNGATGQFVQEGLDLGQRMVHAFQQVLNLDYKEAILIGTDLPTLPVSYLRRAFQLIADADVVLGPSIDGGYYLVGLKRLVSELFAGIDWSTSRVLEQTLRKAESLGLAVELLEPWYDVDTPDDLARLKRDLVTMKEAGDKELPIYTAAELLEEGTNTTIPQYAGDLSPHS